jgi:hypothetical protein
MNYNRWSSHAGVLGLLIQLTLLFASSARASESYNVVLLPHRYVSASFGVDQGRAIGGESQGTSFYSVWWPTQTEEVTLPFLPGFSDANAYGISGNQITGDAFLDWTHAMLWTVSSSGINVVDLNPSGALSSSAYATDGVHQVGTVISSGSPGGLPSYPALWMGSASSVINLGAPGFLEATAAGISGGIEVGNGLLPSPSHALLWRGSGGSPVDLNPPGYQSSLAVGISGSQVVGAAFAAQSSHAALWTGQSAGTFVDLNPSPGVTSKLTATNGVQQTGTVTMSDGHEVAEVWRGTAGSAQVLPGVTGYSFTEANAIDRDGNIVGIARNAVSGGAPVPVMWVPHRLAGDADFDGRVDYSDLFILSQHYGQSGNGIGFVDGDFNMDRTVNFSDLLILAQNYGAMVGTDQPESLAWPARLATQAPFSQVPEPGPTVLLLSCLTLLSFRCQPMARESED